MHRRALLTAACGTCAAALAGCSTYGRPAAAPAPVAAAPAPTGPPPTADATGPDATGPDATAEPLPPDAIPVAGIPVGGGTIFADRDLVVTQPEAGEYRAFSATCTHQGCAVTEVADGGIVCACHGSVFSASDGSPQAGPATAALAERNITVRDGAVVVA